MFLRFLPILVFAVVFLVLSFSLVKAQDKRHTPRPIELRPHKDVCASVSMGIGRCHSKVITDKNGTPAVTSGPTGYGPLQFLTAYNLPSSASAGNPIIAIVDAYDDPTAFSDLSTYSAQFGIPQLPQCVGSIASSPVPCFAKIDQNGGTNYPPFNSGWALEISMDIQVAHAICQNCKIILVEAASNSFTNLLTAENQAVAQGAIAVSNSWSAGEFSGETSYDSYFNHPGVAITAASGDNGYAAGPQYPAASQYVIAVGGTTLQINTDNTYNNESVWNGAGSGCSLYQTKPSWQKDTGCTKRTLTDISAAADPNTGAAVYDSSYSPAGWLQVGGTSLSTPIIAAVYGLAGVKPSIQEASVLYTNPSAFHDVAVGNNGTCTIPYLCTAGVGYDGPTGLGTPNGLSGFMGLVGPTATPTPTPTSAPTPTLTNTPVPMSISITNPLNGSLVLRRSIVNITTAITGPVVRVVFRVNGSSICSDSSAPFTCNWSVPNRTGYTYNLTATAYNSLNKTINSAPIKVVSK